MIGTIDSIEFTTRVIPEPSTWALAVLGMLGMAALGRRRAG